MDKDVAIMKDVMNIKEVSSINRLENEYDLHKASLLELKVRLMADEDPGLKSVRKKIRDLIKEYESRVWPGVENISDAQIEKSEVAEEIVSLEQKFINKRKKSIRKKIEEFDMTQQELGLLLGRPKSYMSELINGVSQFTMKDLVIIHRIFGIGLNTLIPTYLQPATTRRVKGSMKKSNNPKPRLRNRELA